MGLGPRQHQNPQTQSLELLERFSREVQGWGLVRVLRPQGKAGRAAGPEQGGPRVGRIWTREDP